jgi:hypothetical protein
MRSEAHDECEPEAGSSTESSTREERIALGRDTESRLRDFLLAERWTWASFVLHAVCVYCMNVFPPASSALALDMLSDDARYARYLATPIERPPLDLFETGKLETGQEGAKAADSEGRAGKSDAPQKPRRMSGGSKRHVSVDPRTSAREAGILGVLTAQRFVPDGPGDFDLHGTGGGEISAIGQIMGAEIGDSLGFGGLGMRGTGRGGGGDALGSVGVGEIGRLGAGIGGGCPGCVPTGKVPERVARVPQIRTLETVVAGGLAKEVIRRVVQRHLNEVRFCYEEGLRAAPELAGRVEVKFVIAPSGAVQAANVAGSTLAGDRAETAQCIALAVRRWSFPMPEGGGVAIVTYPFLLEAAR